jgi:hypothetical protein
MKTLVRILLLAACAAPAAAAAEDVVTRAMRDELKRSMAKLHLEDFEKPYFIAYRVDEERTYTVAGSLGVVTSENDDKSRQLAVEVRVGDYDFDNTNFISMQGFGDFGGRAGHGVLPLDDDYDALRRVLWLTTDEAYKDAATQLKAKRSVLEQRRSEKKIPDFLKQEPTTHAEPRADLRFDPAGLRQLVRTASAVFRDQPQILSSSVTVVVRILYTRYLSSEGTFWVRGEPNVVVNIQARTYGPNGAPLSDSAEVLARSGEALNADDLVRRARGVLAHLRTMEKAAAAERYNGPVLFEDAAAGEVLSQVFAPAISAFRFPVSDQPQFEAAFQQMAAQFGGTTLADRLGGRVMPDFLDLTDMPRAESVNGLTLLGGRKIDDDGVPTREVKLVENGILKKMLSTRVPTPEVSESTGSKRMFGATPSNLVLSSRKSLPAAELRKELLRLAAEGGHKSALIVRRVGGSGLNWTQRMAGSVAGGAPVTAAIHVLRLSPDGREEVVHGAEIELLTPAAFRNIVAVGDTPSVYHSGFVPGMSSIFAVMSGGLRGDLLTVVSYVTPPLLFDEISIKVANNAAPNPPVVPSPLGAAR